MSIFTFPQSPTVGEIHTQNNISWIWTGSTWDHYTEYPTKPIHLLYNTLNDLYNGQQDQYENFIYYVAENDTYYEYLGTTNGDLSDYNPINEYIHPAYTPINETLSGATVLANFTTDSIGSVTGFTTRTLTALDLGVNVSLYVPYTGATNNVDLGIYGLTTEYIKFNTNPTLGDVDPGELIWSSDDETLFLGLDTNVTHKIGQETFFYVKNQTGSTIPKGTVVRADGTLGSSGRILIAPFIADGSFPSKFLIGVTAESIPNGSDGFVTSFGKIRKIDTSLYPEGTILYASPLTSGGFTDIVPVAPNNIITVAIVITSDNINGEIFVRPTFGSNINDDEGVSIVTPMSNHLLVYDTNTELWVNRSLTDINGVLNTTTLTFITNNGITGGATQTLENNRTWTFGLTGQALALHNLGTNGFIVRTGTDSVTSRTLIAGAGILITNGDGVDNNPIITSTITQYTDALARTSISLTTNGNSGVSTYNNITGVFNIPNYTLEGLGGEPVFNKGTIIQGNGISLSGTLTNRLVESGDLTITHADTSTQTSVTNTDGTVIQSIQLDEFGHITLLNTLNLDNRYYTQSIIDSTLLNYQSLSEKGQPDGYTPLDSNGKIPLIHISDSILGQVKYISTWNATTNTPTLSLTPDSTTKGDYYVVSTPGTFAGIDFEIGDWIISNGTSWEKVDNSDAVTTVFGRIGNILAIATDYQNFYVRHDINSQGLTTTQQGNARTNINAQITISGGASTITTTNLTANSVLVSNSSGKVAVSNITTTELNYLDGVTSNIQNQLDSKLEGNEPITLSGDVTGTGTTTIPTTISNNVVTDNKLRQSVAYSVIGRSNSTTGNVSDIIAGANGVLRRSGTGDLIFSTLVTGNIGDSQITYAKIQNVTADRILGRITTNGVVQELTPSQVRNLINVEEGANLYIHPTYTTINQTFTGATVLASITTDAIGSVTGLTTRSLTPADISAVPTSRTLTFTTNNGITGGSSQSLASNRTWTFGLTGQALALHNLGTNGFIVRTGTDSVTSRILVAGDNIEITNPDGVGGNPTISLAASTYSFDEEVFNYTGSTNFTLSVTTPYAVEVYLNGQRLIKTLDWTIAGNVVTVTDPLDTDDEITITYFYNTPDIVLPGLTGSGTTNFITKWGSSSSLTSSSIQDDGNTVTIGGSEILIPNIGTVTSGTTFFTNTSTGIKLITATNLLTSIGAQPAGDYALVSQLHDPVILGTANGLSLSGQQLSLGLASSGVTGALSGTDWDTFDSKIGGSGTTNYIPKFTGAGTIGDSLIFDNGSNVLIGTTTDAGQKLQVAGNILVNTNGQGGLISTYYGANSDGNNIFIGGGGLSSVGVIGATNRGSGNTAVGVEALQSNTTGYRNTANGYLALYFNTSGNNNIANGYAALYNNTTGYYNIANGVGVLLNNTTGYGNTANGYLALFNNTTGYNNTANGLDSGRYINSGAANQTSNNSLYLGYDTRASASGNTNEIVIGASARGVGSNSVILGNSSITKTVLQGNVLINTTTIPSIISTGKVFNMDAGGNGDAYAIFSKDGSTGGWLSFFAGTQDTVMFYKSAGNFRLGSSTASGGSGYSEHFRITGSGNVGIGTTNPSSKLDVVGNVELNGNVSIGNSLSNIHKIDGEILVNVDTKLGTVVPGKVFNMDGGGDSSFAIYSQNGSTGGWLSFFAGTSETVMFFKKTTGTFRFGASDQAGGANFSEFYRVTGGGNFIIGTTTDNGEKLQVNGNVTATNFIGSLIGNASSATILQTSRTINGTSFNGSANITTANWGTARNITIGVTSKSLNGSTDVSWDLTDIGALSTSGGSITGNLSIGGQIYSPTNAKGNSGTGTVTFNWNDGNIQTVTLTGNCTFAFSNPQSGATYQIIITQDATGSRTITWPTIHWEGKTTPTLTGTASSVDVVTLTYDGSKYIGVMAKNFGTP